MNNELTIAERILVEWARRLGEMDTTTHTVQWLHVERAPLDQQTKLMGDAVAIYQTNERNSYETGRVLCTLRAGVEFWYKTKHGDVPSTELNRLAGDLKRLFMSDHHTTEDVTGDQLSLAVRPVATEFDIDGPKDGYVSGFMELDIQFRHAPTDPRTLM